MTAFVNSQSAQAQGNQAPNAQLPNTQAPDAQAPNMVPGATLGPPMNNVQTPGFNASGGGLNDSLAIPGNQNSAYPQGWPGNQLPSAPNNTLPGNNSPAGPEPF